MNSLLKIIFEATGKLGATIGFRLANRYTGVGSTLFLVAMAEKGIISHDYIPILQNIPNISFYIVIVLAIYFIIHVPKFKDDMSAMRVLKKEREYKIKKIELDMLKLNIEINKIKENDNKYIKKPTS